MDELSEHEMKKASYKKMCCFGGFRPIQDK